MPNRMTRQSIPKPQAAPKPQIKHFSDHQEEMKSDPTKPKQVRTSKDPMSKQLEKIAKNTAHPEESKAERSLRSFEHMKQREMVRDFRYPQRANAMVIAKEYGSLDEIGQNNKNLNALARK